MSLSIENPGLLTTIQDAGRFGYQQYGVSVSGAMDVVAMRMANMLSGNEENTPVIELTRPGPTIRFTKDHLIAVCGANMSATLNRKPLPMWKSVLAEEGSLLEFGREGNGRFACLAIAGGPDVPEVMGSASTYLQGGFGGFRGRALRKGDHIICGEPSALSTKIRQNIIAGRDNTTRWIPAPPLIPHYPDEPVVGAVKGPDYELFSEEAKRIFWEERFTISRKSGRMGYQLEGPVLPLSQAGEILSTAVTFGTVQVASGKTIILAADRQTTGGYPVIAQIITTSLPEFVQLQPGKVIRFKEFSPEEAQQVLYRREKDLQKLKRAIYLKYS